MSQEFLDAIRGGDATRAASMLEADPSLAAARDANGVSAILWAAYSGHRELAQAIGARRDDLDLFEATAIGAADRVKALLAGDPGLVRSYSPDGWTPLHLASFFGYPEVVQLLLGAGAPLEARSRNTLANTALNAAAAANRIEVARLLLERGADPNSRQHNAISPLHSAAFNGNLDMVKLLLEHHADPGAITEENRTAAGMAEEKGHEEIATLLRQKLAALVS
jgi:uncharacterized protein